MNYNCSPKIDESYFVGIYYGSLTDSKMKKLDFRETEILNDFLKNRYSHENVTKIMNFYFNNCDFEDETIRLENITRVSIYLSILPIHSFVSS